jgi:(p)ppGpp synthase/HD superfamily hydrolase
LLQHRISDSRIFISTPKGHVLELPPEATVLDFAYRVHTAIGHTCRGARINGMLGPLNRRLETGQQVEIITRADLPPQRDWLEDALGFVHTDRARAKLVSYFRHLPLSAQEKIGCDSIVNKLASLGVTSLTQVQLLELASQNDKSNPAELWQAIGSGELSAIDVIVALAGHEKITGQMHLPGFQETDFPHSARFRLTAENRDGLLHDITQVIGDMSIALTGTTGRVSNASSQAIISIDVTLASWQQSVEFVSYLGLIEGVTEIRKEAI